MSTQAQDQLPLGLAQGQAVMEIGFDADCDDAIRHAFATAIGADLLDEDSDEIVEAVLLWWRDDDAPPCPNRGADPAIAHSQRSRRPATGTRAGHLGLTLALRQPHMVAGGG